MCGRYSLTNRRREALNRKFGVPPGPTTPRYNCAPGQIHEVVSQEGGETVWARMQWGNQISSSSRADFLPINARSETVASKPTFCDSFREKRCLIPADGWFEWQLIETQRYPHFVRKKDHSTFAFAGTWKELLPESLHRQAFTIITRSAPPNLMHLHHRAPAIIRESDWEKWLAGKSGEEKLIEMMSCDQPELEAIQVSSKVNSTRNDGPELLEPESGKQSLLF